MWETKTTVGGRNMNVVGKIDQAIALEIDLKDIKKRLEIAKAELQSELYADMLNKNLKWIQESALLVCAMLP